RPEAAVHADEERAEVATEDDPVLVTSATIALGASDGDVVLVVDDDPIARDLLKHHLQAASLEVMQAASGDEALELAKRHRPAAITLDVMMPGMDGWTVLQRLKDDPETASIPVVMVSMVADQSVGVALGA